MIGYDTVIVICGLLGLGIGAVYWLMRVGFDNPVSPVAKSISLGLFLFTFPAVASGELIHRRFESGAIAGWWRSYPFLWLVGLGLTAILGRLVPVLGINPFPAIAVVGVLAYGVVVFRWLGGASVWRSLVIVASSGAFSVWASGVVWGRIYKNPLFLRAERLAPLAAFDALPV